MQLSISCHPGNMMKNNLLPRSSPTFQRGKHHPNSCYRFSRTSESLRLQNGAHSTSHSFMSLLHCGMPTRHVAGMLTSHLSCESGLVRLPCFRSIQPSTVHLIILNSTLQTANTWTLVVSLNARSNHVQSTGLILKA